MRIVDYWIVREEKASINKCYRSKKQITYISTHTCLFYETMKLRVELSLIDILRSIMQTFNIERVEMIKFLIKYLIRHFINFIQVSFLLHYTSFISQSINRYLIFYLNK